MKEDIMFFQFPLDFPTWHSLSEKPRKKMMWGKKKCSEGWLFEYHLHTLNHLLHKHFLNWIGVIGEFNSNIANPINWHSKKEFYDWIFEPKGASFFVCFLCSEKNNFDDWIFRGKKVFDTTCSSVCPSLLMNWWIQLIQSDGKSFKVVVQKSGNRANNIKKFLTTPFATLFLVNWKL